MRTLPFLFILGASIALVLVEGCALDWGPSPSPTPGWLPVAIEAEHSRTRVSIRNRMEYMASTWGDNPSVPLPAIDSETGWEASIIAEGSWDRFAMSCYSGLGYSDRYRWNDPTIVSAPGTRRGGPPCGAIVRVTNPENGVVLYGYVVHQCVDCPANRLKLSKAGMTWLCGLEWPETCDKLSGLTVEELLLR